MIRINNVKLRLDYTQNDIEKAVLKELRIDKKAIDSISLFRRSVDARHKNDVHFIATFDVKLNTNENNAISKSKSKNAIICDEYKYTIPYKNDLK